MVSSSGSASRHRHHQAVVLPKAVVQQEIVIFHDVPAAAVKAGGIAGLFGALHHAQNAQKRAEPCGKPAQEGTHPGGNMPLTAAQPVLRPAAQLGPTVRKRGQRGADHHAGHQEPLQGVPGQLQERAGKAVQRRIQKAQHGSGGQQGTQGAE